MGVCECAGSTSTSFDLSMNRVWLQGAAGKHCLLVITLIYRVEIEILVCPRLHLFPLFPKIAEEAILVSW